MHIKTELQPQRSHTEASEQTDLKTPHVSRTVAQIDMQVHGGAHHTHIHIKTLRHFLARSCAIYHPMPVLEKGPGADAHRHINTVLVTLTSQIIYPHKNTQSLTWFPIPQT